MLMVRTRFPRFFRGGRDMAVTHLTVTDLTDSGA
jgi:hypothetical protein